MKPGHVYSLISLIALICCLSLTNCSRKTGCPATETTVVKVNKNGAPKKKASSGLFDKKTQRRMRKGK